MRITMLGCGYVGLVSGACFADFGHHVALVDVAADRVAALNGGRIPIYEPGLEEMVSRNVANGRMTFTTDLSKGMKDTDVVFIAVGTPTRRGGGGADLTYVHEAARQIAQNLRGYTVIVNKSTVPVGTGDEVESIIREANPSAEFSVVSNPEFLREGAAIHDFKHPDRIVIGVEEERARPVMEEVYRPLHINRGPLLFTGRRTAELIKYAANAFLALKVTYINEMADLCERVGADVQDVARGIGLDNRIGPKFLHAGPGYGGSCFPKDTRALVETARAAESPTRLVEITVEINDRRKRAMAEKVMDACGGEVDGKRIAVLGLTFKPNTDDMREAPSLDIVPALIAAGAVVHAYDPHGMDEARPLLPDVVLHESPYDTLNGASACVIITEWDAFRALELPLVRQRMKEPVIVDLRNIYNPERVRGAGFRYFSVGRG